MKRIVYLNVLVGVLIFSSSGKTSKTEISESADMETEEVAVNTLSAKEKEEGWILLFDGNSLEGWRGYNRKDMPGAWTIEGDALKVNGSGAGAADSTDGGDIIYDRKFKNFELQFEWKVSKGGNSGIFYLAREFDDLPIYRSAPEYQILDNEGHPDAERGISGNRQSASLYDLIPADPQNSNPAGEWNTGGIKVLKGAVVHSQNGQNVLEYQLWSSEWEKMIEDSKFKGWEEMINAGGEERSGYIGLQDHDDEVWFRNIKLKVLD